METLFGQINQVQVDRAPSFALPTPGELLFQILLTPQPFLIFTGLIFILNLYLNLILHLSRRFTTIIRSFILWVSLAIILVPSTYVLSGEIVSSLVTGLGLTLLCLILAMLYPKIQFHSLIRRIFITFFLTFIFFIACIYIWLYLARSPLVQRPPDY